MYFFILGTHPDLSKAEIESVLGHACPAIQGHVLFVDDESQNASLLQQQLAGTIKIGQIIGETGSYQQSQTAQLIAQFAATAAGKNKIKFGISVYDIGAEKKAQSIAYDRDDLGKDIKKILKETGRPVRYVSSKEPELSSVIVEENDLLSSGGEFCLFVDKTIVLVGQTEAVQDFKAWSTRDFGRPARDSKSGMLPPKLARIMINLAGVKPSDVLLDPFCGSGTVLMEADLLGIETIIGSDISPKAIEDTTENFEWLNQYYDVNQTIIEHLYVSPAETLHTVLTKPVDVIVSETYLGKPRTKPANEMEIEKTTQELFPLYESSFKTLRTLIKPGGLAVVAFPAFTMEDKSVHHLPLTGLLQRAGWSVIDSFLYKRPDQFVGRDIIRIKAA